MNERRIAAYDILGTIMSVLSSQLQAARLSLPEVRHVASPIAKRTNPGNSQLARRRRRIFAYGASGQSGAARRNRR